LSRATVHEPAKVRDPWSPTLDNCTAATTARVGRALSIGFDRRRPRGRLQLPAELHGDIREKGLGPELHGDARGDDGSDPGVMIGGSVLQARGRARIIAHAPKRPSHEVERPIAHQRHCRSHFNSKSNSKRTLLQMKPSISLLRDVKMSKQFEKTANAVVFQGDCMDLLRQIPDNALQLVVTSPPYNIGKEYERRLDLDQYVAQQAAVITQCVRALSKRGSICWQVGNYVDNGAIIPLDTILYPVFRSLGLKMRNRIVWHFEHGLHCSNRLSGRYETIVWFTKSDDYTFHLNPIRVPQKYPGKKHFKGPKAGQYSGNPLGKNPGDVWVIPNVKSNHVEKTDHPCQFPIELVERLVLSMTNPGDWVFDPFAGVGSTMIAAIRHGRRGAGAEIMSNYVKIALDRLKADCAGMLRTRPMNQPVYDPKAAGNSLTVSPWDSEGNRRQLRLIDQKLPKYRVK